MKKILCSALVMIMMLCMVACGSSEAGRYDFYSMDMDGVSITAEDLKEMGAEMEMYITLEKDGTGVLVSEGETMEIAWEDGKMWPVDDADDVIAYTIDGDTLTMDQDGVTITFKK